MTNFHAWAADKPPAIRFMAYSICSNLDDWHYKLTNARRAPLSDVFPNGINLHKWLSLYRDNKSIIASLAPLSEPLANDIGLPIDHLYKAKADEISEAGYAHVLETFQEFEQTDTSPHSDLDLSNNFFELIFLLKIYIPCIILHCTLPGWLLRSARCGDQKCLTKLLKIDSLILYDAGVQRLITRKVANNDTIFMEEVGNAIAQTYKPITLKRLKILAASFLFYGAKANGLQVTATEIINLFDAIAQDRLGVAQDPDLDMAPHGFDKQIRRYRHLWR